MSRSTSYRTVPVHLGFTLIELLVVMGLISLLTGLLLPVVSAATKNARAIQCQANVRQIEIELVSYANINRGKFPPNLSTPTGFTWVDSDKIGKLTPHETDLRGPIATCPEDPEAKRSYAMNVWASSAIDVSVKTVNADQPWTFGAKCSDRLILVTEKWSSSGTQGSWATPTPPIIGATKATPAQRFGGGTGLNPLFNAGRFKPVNSELPFQRHRIAHAGFGTQPVGRVTIGYLDGHVEMVSNDKLVNGSTGLSTLQSMWSPMDPVLNK